MGFHWKLKLMKVYILLLSSKKKFKFKVDMDRHFELFNTYCLHLTNIVMLANFRHINKV